MTRFHISAPDSFDKTKLKSRAAEEDIPISRLAVALFRMFLDGELDVSKVKEKVEDIYNDREAGHVHKDSNGS